MFGGGAVGAIAPPVPLMAVNSSEAFPEVNIRFYIQCIALSGGGYE